jgi:hypothetical protein
MHGEHLRCPYLSLSLFLEKENTQLTPNTQTDKQNTKNKQIKQIKHQNKQHQHNTITEYLQHYKTINSHEQ